MEYTESGAWHFPTRPPPQTQFGLHQKRFGGYGKILIVGYLLAIAWIWLSHPGLVAYDGQAKGSDFVAFYAASEMVQQGQAATVYNLDVFSQQVNDVVGAAVEPLPVHYPPTYFLLISPLATFPYPVAYAIWTGLALVVWIFVGRALRVHTSKWWPFFAAPALYVCITHGQNGWMTAGLLCAGVLLLKKHPLWAGLAFSVLFVKPQFLIVVPLALLATKQWRALAGLTLGVGTLTVLSLLAYGVDTWHVFLDHSSDTLALLANGFVPVYKMPTLSASLVSLSLPAQATLLAQGAYSLFVAVLVAVIFKRSQSQAVRLAAIGFGTIAAAPFAFDYDLVILVPGIVALISSQLLYNRKEQVLMLAAAFLPLFQYAVSNVVANLGFVLIALCLAIVWRKT